MLTIMVFIYCCVTFFLTGEAQPLYLVPAIILDGAAIHVFGK